MRGLQGDSLSPMDKDTYLDGLPGSNRTPSADGAWTRAVAVMNGRAKAQRRVNREVGVEVHWVTGHVEVEGNEQADKTGKLAAEGTGARGCTERFASLHNINLAIAETKWKEAKYWFRAKNKARPHMWCTQYDLVLSTLMVNMMAMCKKAHANSLQLVQVWTRTDRHIF